VGLAGPCQGPGLPPHIHFSGSQGHRYALHVLWVGTTASLSLPLNSHGFLQALVPSNTQLFVPASPTSSTSSFVYS
jgi:hypothetical protein